MEEQEVPIEHLHDIVHGHAPRVTWAEKVALTTALFAVFAAVSSLISTHESDLAILYRVESSDQWSYYQAKSIKEAITQNPDEKARYEREQEGIRKEAEAKTEASEHAMHVHEYCAFAETIFQVATALGAIAILVKLKPIWFTSVFLGLAGLGLIIKAISLF